MDITWFKNILSSVLPGSRGESIGQGARVFEKKAQVRLEEEPEEVSFFGEAQRKALQLLSFIPRSGAEKLDRFWSRLGVRKKVKKNIASFYDDPEIIDEVTETLRQAAEADPFYKRLFR